MMRSHRLALLGLVAALSCNARGDVSDVESLPEYFLVPAGAEDVLVSQANSLGERSVSFRLRNFYPAVSTSNGIRDRLGALGFSIRSENMLNPGLALDEGDKWHSFADGTTSPSSCVWQWWREWDANDGTVVTYILRYRYPESDPRRCSTPPSTDDLQVTALVSPPEAVQWHREAPK